MRYVAIDLETTGLNPEISQILELAMVLDDTAKPEAPVGQLPAFHIYLDHGSFQGQAKALAMNSRIFDIIAEGRSPLIRECHNQADKAAICNEIGTFFEHFEAEGSITPAGKNFASFDRNFLLPFSDGSLKFGYTHFKHRTIDVGNLFWHPAEDNELPNMDLCCFRADIGKGTKHEALDDCRLVIECIRSYIKNRPLP